MKKNFNFYVIIWAIGLVIFNLIAFLVPGDTKFTTNFWVGYAFITVAFILQLITAFLAFKEENLNKLFLNIPTVTISFGALGGTILIAGLTMAIPDMPEWLGVILCFICFGVGVAAVLTSKAAADTVSGIDTKIKTKTFFVKALTVDVDTLASQAQTAEIKAQVTKVYEAIRYSDPMSSDALSNEETQIKLKFNQLRNAVVSNDAQAVNVFADEMIVLLKDRNNKCKLLK